MRLALPSDAELMAACVAIGAAQTAIVLRFLARRVAASRAPLPARCPPAAVIVPCKGDFPGLAENLAAFASQRYPGEYELVLVAASESDSALAAMRACPGARALVSGAVPTRSSEKCLNIVHGAARARPGVELLVFADSDLRPHPDWLRELAAESEPGVVMTTAALPPLELRGWRETLRLLWIGHGIPYLDLLGCPVGHSLAVRRESYDALGLAERWSRSVYEDLSLLSLPSPRVRFSPRALVLSAEQDGAANAARVFDRWMTAFRHYAPRVWAPGALLTAFKLYVLTRLWDSAPLAAAWFAADAVPLALLFAGYRLAFGRGGAPAAALAAAAAACAPLLLLLHARNFIVSALSSRIVWSGYSYRFLRGGGVGVSAAD